MLLATITCRFISGDEISCHLFVHASIMTDCDTKLRQDLGVPKYKDLASLTQRKAELEKWLLAMRHVIEKDALRFLFQRNLQLDVNNGQSETGWIFVSTL